MTSQSSGDSESVPDWASGGSKRVSLTEEDWALFHQENEEWAARERLLKAKTVVMCRVLDYRYTLTHRPSVSTFVQLFLAAKPVGRGVEGCAILKELALKVASGGESFSPSRDLHQFTDCNGHVTVSVNGAMHHLYATGHMNGAVRVVREQGDPGDSCTKLAYTFEVASTPTEMCSACFLCDKNVHRFHLDVPICPSCFEEQLEKREWSEEEQDEIEYRVNAMLEEENLDRDEYRGIDEW